MNTVIESVDVNKAMEICKNDKHIHLQPAFEFNGNVKGNIVDVIINDVCSIKQTIEYDGLQMVTKLGHVINIKYTDYEKISIL